MVWPVGIWAWCQEMRTLCLCYPAHTPTLAFTAFSSIAVSVHLWAHIIGFRCRCSFNTFKNLTCPIQSTMIWELKQTSGKQSLHFCPLAMQLEGETARQLSIFYCKWFSTWLGRRLALWEDSYEWWVGTGEQFLWVWQWANTHNIYFVMLKDTV